MSNSDSELKEILIKIGKMSERELDNISNNIDEIVEYKIEDERTISNVFDQILSIVFIEDDKKRKVFYKLSNYCRKFNKELADDYDKILEEDLTDDCEEMFENKTDSEKIKKHKKGSR